jgi:hypothetical protein
MSKFTDIVKGITSGNGVPYNYKVGAPSSPSSGLPFNVKLSIDPNFQKTIVTVASIIAGGVALGTAVGIFIAKRK